MYGGKYSNMWKHDRGLMMSDNITGRPSVRRWGKKKKPEEGPYYSCAGLRAQCIIFCLSVCALTLVDAKHVESELYDLIGSGQRRMCKGGQNEEDRGCMDEREYMKQPAFKATLKVTVYKHKKEPNVEHCNQVSPKVHKLHAGGRQGRR